MRKIQLENSRQMFLYWNQNTQWLIHTPTEGIETKLKTKLTILYDSTYKTLVKKSNANVICNRLQMNTYSLY